MFDDAAFDDAVGATGVAAWRGTRGVREKRVVVTAGAVAVMVIAASS
jgi:hypothetical protein